MDIVIGVLVVLLLGAALYIWRFHAASLSADVKDAEAGAATGIATVKADVLGAVARVESLLHIQHASVVAKIAALPAIPTNQPTTLTPGVAGLVTPAPAGPDTYNGVPVPAGLTLQAFTMLGEATKNVAAALANTGLAAALLTSTSLWWNALGSFMREEYLAQATGATLAAFTALQATASAPALVPITAAQQAAANQAAGVKA